jgi:hypothetical protein
LLKDSRKAAPAELIKNLLVESHPLPLDLLLTDCSKLKWRLSLIR